MRIQTHEFYWRRVVDVNNNNGTDGRLLAFFKNIKIALPYVKDVATSAQVLKKTTGLVKTRQSRFCKVSLSEGIFTYSPHQESNDVTKILLTRVKDVIVLRGDKAKDKFEFLIKEEKRDYEIRASSDLERFQFLLIFSAFFELRARLAINK